MTQSLYFIEAICIKELKCPNIIFNIGDVFWVNPKAHGNDMYLFYSYRDKCHLTEEEKDRIRKQFGWTSWIPFTKQKRFAKKWKVRKYAETIQSGIEYRLKDYFKFDIKEIKVTYTEEEV